MKSIEKQQIEMLRRHKQLLISKLVCDCEEINRQIAEVKSGKWLRRITGKDTK